VISFIFADLIAFPLLLIYRRFYGTRLALRMLAVFWAVMSTAGLITEGIFRAAGLVPTTRPATVVPAHFSFDYTTWLNIVFLVLFAVLYWTYRNRARFGAGQAMQRPGVRDAGRSPPCARHGGPRRHHHLLLLGPLRDPLPCRPGQVRAWSGRCPGGARRRARRLGPAHRARP